MPRFTVSVTDEQDAWIERQAAAQDRSKSQIVRRLIEARRTDDRAFTDPVNAADADAVNGGGGSTVNAADADAVNGGEGSTMNDGEGPSMNGGEPSGPVGERLDAVVDRLDAIESRLAASAGTAAEPAHADVPAESGDDAIESPDAGPAEPTTAEREGDLIIAPSGGGESRGTESPPSTDGPSTEPASTEPADASASDADDSGTPEASRSGPPGASESGTLGASESGTPGAGESTADLAPFDDDQVTDGGESTGNRPGQRPRIGTTGRWPTGDHPPDPTSNGAGGQPAGTSAGRSTDDGPSGSEADEPSGNDALDPDRVRAAIEASVDDDLAGSVFDCWRELRRRGTADERLFETLFDGQGPYDSAESWWNDASEHLESLPGVVPPTDGGRFYRYSYRPRSEG